MAIGAFGGDMHTAGDMFTNADHKPKGSASLTAVLSAFVPTWLAGCVFVVIFVLIRSRFPNIYAPRTFMGTIPEKHHTPSQNSRYFGWVRTMYRVPDKFLLYHQPLDSYLYLRFLRTIIFICLVGCFLTWPTLMPINAAGGGSSTSLDRVGIGNIENRTLLYAHAVLAWVFFVFVMFTIARERLWLIGLRQAWTLSKNNTSRLSSRIVLFLSAPRDAIEESNMNRFFGDGAVRIWPATQASSLNALVSDRNKKLEQLEVAETSLIQRAWQKARKEAKGSSQSDGEPSWEDIPQTIKEAIRPKHRLTYSLASEKVDTIQWLRKQIKEIESEIQKARQQRDETGSHGARAVFVEFKTIADAQRTSQSVASAEILALNPRYLGVAPKEVIWPNLCITPEKRIFQEGIGLGLVAALIVFWSIPSSFVGLVSNVSYLAENVEWLAWLENLPDSVIGLVSGLVPPLLTSMLSSYVPNIFRYIFKSFGAATTTTNELKVQKWFYIFQVTQVFLVTAVFSGAATVFSELVHEVKDPISIPELLARQLPKSSNYYITYFIIQGITASSDNLLNWSTLLQYYVFGWLFDKTPQQKFQRYTNMKGIAWGKVFSKFANFAIIAIAYSCIAPLVLGFATVGLALYYYSYRYNLLFVIRPSIDTRGQAYTLALQHLLTGVYIAELALLGLFGLDSATGPSIMLLILFFVTILYNALMNRYLAPLEMYLPADLANEHGAGDESTPLLASAEEGRADDQQRSNIQHISRRTHIPPQVVDPLMRFFQPRIFASYRAMEAWLREDAADFQHFEEDTTEYSEEQLKKAYVNPLLASSTPIIWVPRDGFGASKNEVRESEKSGLKASDEAAWVDEKGRVRWNERDFENVPIWKSDVLY